MFCIFLPQPTNKPSLQGILVPFENGIRNLHLGVGQGVEMSEGVPRHHYFPVQERTSLLLGGDCAVAASQQWCPDAAGNPPVAGSYMFPERRTLK